VIGTKIAHLAFKRPQDLNAVTKAATDVERRHPRDWRMSDGGHNSK
jgi:hypothetical protein